MLSAIIGYRKGDVSLDASLILPCSAKSMESSDPTSGPGSSVGETLRLGPIRVDTLMISLKQGISGLRRVRRRLDPPPSSPAPRFSLPHPRRRPFEVKDLDALFFVTERLWRGKEGAHLSFFSVVTPDDQIDRRDSRFGAPGLPTLCPPKWFAMRLRQPSVSLGLVHGDQRTSDTRSNLVGSET